MRHRTRTVVGAAGALALSATLAPLTASQAAATDHSSDGIHAVGLTVFNRLVDIDVTNGEVGSSTRIRGLEPGDRVVGIDYRPADGELYGVVRDRTGGAVVVQIDDESARIVSSTDLVGADGAQIRLDGRSFGVDFNPAADALRITSDADQNLRAKVDTGLTTVDGRLAYQSGDPADGKDPSIVASAYTNSDQDPAGSTTLYGLDSRRNALVLQAPPNDGVLATVGSLDGLDVATTSSFDITADTDVGVIATRSVLGTRLQLVDVQTADLLLSRQLYLTFVTGLALTPGG